MYSSVDINGKTWKGSINVDTDFKKNIRIYVMYPQKQDWQKKETYKQGYQSHRRGAKYASNIVVKSIFQKQTNYTYTYACLQIRLYINLTISC